MGKSVIVQLDDTNWEKIVEKGSKPVMVMFTSPTCPYCHQMEPSFDQYADEFKNKVVFGKANIVNSQTIVNRYGIMGTPTFKYFCKGHPIQESSGAVYPPLLKKMVEDGLNHGSDCEQKTSWIDPSYG